MTIAEMVSRAKNDYDEVFEAGRQSFIADLTFVDVESNATTITVPEGVLPAARINKIGGMSYTTTNQIPFPYRYGGAGDVVELNGVTFTILDDGGISVVGVPNTMFTWDIFQAEPYDDYGNPNPINVLPLKNGNWYTLSGTPDFNVRLVSTVKLNSDPFGYGGIVQWCEDNTVGQISYEMFQGYRLHTVSLEFIEGSVGTEINTVIYPMLNEGGTALPYEQYFADLRSASVSKLESEFGNLFNYDNVNPQYKVGNNVININHSGYYTDLFSGTTGYASKFPLEYADRLMYLTVGTYNAYFNMTFDGEGTDEALGVRVVNLLDGSLGGGATFNSGSSFRIEKNGYYTIRKSNNLKSTITNLMITRKPQTEYIPYRGDDLFVPVPIRLLDGYGWGVNSEYYNYIDFERKVFVKRVHRKVFDGTENWGSGQSSTSHKKRVVLSKTVSWDGKYPITVSNTSSLAPIISNMYKVVSADDTWFNVNGICINNLGELVIYDEEYNTSDISLWKAHLAELYASGNPLVIDYALAEPIETDISAYYTDKYINVEGGGTITAVNEYGYDVPTNISYIFDKQGG